MRIPRASRVALGCLAASVAACAYNPPPTSVPVGAYPNAPAVAVVPAGVEYGRVTNIQFFQTAAAARTQNVPGAILGGVAGAVVGNAVGHAVGGSNARAAGTVLGGAAGMALGSQAPGPAVASGAGVYRLTVQTDQGVMRTFDVPSPGDLHVGDRVRVDNGVIYHY